MHRLRRRGRRGGGRDQARPPHPGSTAADGHRAPRCVAVRQHQAPRAATRPPPRGQQDSQHRLALHRGLDHRALDDATELITRATRAAQVAQVAGPPISLNAHRGTPMTVEIRWQRRTTQHDNYTGTPPGFDTTTQPPPRPTEPGATGLAAQPVYKATNPHCLNSLDTFGGAGLNLWWLGWSSGSTCRNPATKRFSEVRPPGRFTEKFLPTPPRSARSL